MTLEVLKALEFCMNQDSCKNCPVLLEDAM